MGLGGPQAWLLNLPTAVVYGSLTLFITVLHNVFLLYYVDTFVSVYKISKAAFWVGETVFLLWNSLNDPLFGWLSDRQFLSSQPRLCGEEAGNITLGQYLWQLAHHRNFLWFVVMDLVQVFHCHFNSNFFPLFLEHLLSDHISLSTGSFLLGHDLFQQSPLTPVGRAQPWPEPPAPPPVQAPTLRQGCFYLLVLVPITCALLQLFTWSKFTLHGRRLRMVKAQRQNLSQVQTLDIKTV